MAFESAIIANPIEGSFCFGENLEGWVRIRQFLSGPINDSGSLLDVGCANGFFLKSCMDWRRPLTLVPFGIDVRTSSILEAKSMLASYANNFTVCDIRDIKSIASLGLLSNYQFVFCSLFGPGGFDCIEVEALLHDLYSLVRPGGRLILGLYGRFGGSTEVCNVPGGAEEYQQLIARAKYLRGFGIAFREPEPNPNGTNQVLIWAEKNESVLRVGRQ